ncbi:hypothetical protein N8H22_06540 [Stutzerimonas stutzeri]|uniref:hypothetical protein n=1 Tax=Stutzerimonas sp. S1 TaxID=3030652 RepID=UPI00222442A4|nr:hypothetical protein [Stutzerimonas sp. S1]MCW3148262.1 hypothetical protein [Stutzerimonas sp. S1]
MKRSDGFNARRLRSQEYRSWPLRLGSVIGAVLFVGGMLLFIAGLVSLFGRGEALGALAAEDAATAALVLGLLLLGSGAIVWRWCRRRVRQSSDLSLSPKLMKRRD